MLLTFLILLATSGQPAARFTDFPIMAWWTPPAQVALYEQYKAAGFNVMPLRADNVDGVKLAANTGLSVILRDPGTFWRRLAPARWPERSAENVIGWLLSRDLGLENREGLVTDVEALAQADPSRVVVWNLIPNDEETLDPAQVASGGAFLASYYRLYKGDMEARERAEANMERVARVSVGQKRPFWGAVLCTSHGGFRVPSESDLWWQVYSLLAYGAKGLCYYTYYGPNPEGPDFAVHYEEWKPGILDAAGDKPTERYEVVKKINGEVSALGQTLLGLVWERVGSPYIVRVEGKRSLVTSLTGTDGARYLFVINEAHGEKLSSADSADNLTLTFNDQVAAADRFEMESGRFNPAPLEGRAFSMKLGGGHGVLLRLKLKE